MGSVPIEDRVLHYFLAMGAQPVETPQKAQPGLTFTIGQDTIQVMILSNEELLRGGKIIASIMSLASLRDSANQLYLAAPRLLGTTIEAETFRSQGIGLLLYDDRRIEEAVTPQTYPSHRSEPVPPEQVQAVFNELASLKSMYLEMQNEVNRLREELRGYQERMDSVSTVPDNIPTTMLSPREPRLAGPSSELPSFFSNNPWLEVLSKRGREESLIAG